MQTPRNRHRLKPVGATIQLVVLLLALLVAQPVHWMTCCLSAHSDLATPSAAVPTSYGIPVAVNAEHQREDQHSVAHTASEPGVHQDGFIISPHCVRTSHHHTSCCNNCKIPALTQRDQQFRGDVWVLLPVEGVAVPVFRLDVLNGRCTRAGPAALILRSAQLSSSLSGRSPPHSA